jgi:hypothetical protein
MVRRGYRAGVYERGGGKVARGGAFIPIDGNRLWDLSSMGKRMPDDETGTDVRFVLRSDIGRGCGAFVARSTGRSASGIRVCRRVTLRRRRQGRY